jgi:hypothetical protein
MSFLEITFVLFDFKITKFVMNFQYIAEIAGYLVAGYLNMTKTLYEKSPKKYDIIYEQSLRVKTKHILSHMVPSMYFICAPP